MHTFIVLNQPSLGYLLLILAIIGITAIAAFYLDPIRKKKTEVEPERYPLDENAQKYVNRIFELCEAGKLEWYQARPAESSYRNAFSANYKTLTLVVEFHPRETVLKLINKFEVTAFYRSISHIETRLKLEETVWKHSLANKFLDEFLKDEKA